MSQDTIIEYIKQHPNREFTLTEIARELHINVVSVHNAVKSMLKDDEIPITFLFERRIKNISWNNKKNKKLMKCLL